MATDGEDPDPCSIAAASDSGDAAGSDAGSTVEHGSTLPLLPLGGVLLDSDDDALLEYDDALLEYDGALLECDGALLECDGALLEYDGVLLEYDGVLLEYDGALLEYDDELPDDEQSHSTTRIMRQNAS